MVTLRPHLTMWRQNCRFVAFDTEQKGLITIKKDSRTNKFI